MIYRQQLEDSRNDSIGTGSRRFRWCCDDDECPSPSLSGGGSSGSGGSFLFEHSESGANLTAANIRFEIESGSGRLEIWGISSSNDQLVHHQPIAEGDEIAFTWTP